MEPVRILFLGQCLQYGYDGIERESTFPVLAREFLAQRYPAVHFNFHIKHFYHPIGLAALLRHRLRVLHPDIVVISAPAMFAATSWHVNRVYEMAPEIIDTARSFMRRLAASTRRKPGTPGASTVLDKTFSVRKPIALSEYERLLEEAASICSEYNCRPVFMGPGRFNEDTVESYEVHSPELWSNVNGMIVSLCRRLNVPAIDAQQALAQYGGEVFIPNNHRWSAYGHEVVAREVEQVISAQVAALHSEPSTVILPIQS